MSLFCWSLVPWLLKLHESFKNIYAMCQVEKMLHLHYIQRKLYLKHTAILFLSDLVNLVDFLIDLFSICHTEISDMFIFTQTQDKLLLTKQSSISLAYTISGDYLLVDIQELQTSVPHETPSKCHEASVSESVT